MKPGFIRTLALLGALAAGVLIPQAHVFLWLVRWLIIGMLSVVFLQTRFSRESVQRSHLVLLGVNLLMGGVGWAIGWFAGGENVALACFFAGITPTAAAAPVVTHFLRARTDYVVTAFMLTNIVVAAVFPFVLPWALGRPTPHLFGQVITTVSILVFVPLIASSLLRRVYPKAAEWPKKIGAISFGAWVVSLFIITANASHFLRTQTEVPLSVTWQIAGTSALICAINFALGRVIGGKTFPREASQSLGQKNTSFTIYVAATYANPLVALGPTCYVLWHNLWNSWQLYKARHAPDADKTAAH